MSESMRILWVGDSPTVSTGFAKCTRFACEALYRAGHEVHVLGINEFGDPHSYPYKIYPCINPLDGCTDPFGVNRLPIMIDRIKPDLIVLLNDPWNVPEYFSYLDWVNEGRIAQEMEVINIPPIVGWLAVDSMNQKGAGCNRLAHVIVWTQFAIDELVKGGYTGDWSIIPLGVDTSIFRPLPKAECRAKILPSQIPDDAFIVGVVGRNQPRKRLDLTIRYFAEWIKQYNVENAYLYLYVSPTGERGCDIKSLVDYYKINGKVIVASPEGFGMAEESMPIIYNACDVYLSTSQGEGFGLPALEAMACGISLIVSNCGGFGSWIPENCAFKISCPNTALTAPLNAHPYTIGGIADEKETIGALQKVYLYRELRENMGKNGVEFAQSMSWENVGDAIVNTLEKTFSSFKVA